MAGHGQFKNIMHRKGAQDKKKAKMYTKVIREINVSVKTGGGPDPEMNPRLRAAIAWGKEVNMPKDTIERAIKKASGAEAENYSEVNYEAYGPGGVAIFVEAATDNNTRTVANVRSYFNKFGGSIGKEGCLQFVFERKGTFLIPKGVIKDEDEFTLELIDAGAEDVLVEEEALRVVCLVENFGKLQKKLAELNIEPELAQLVRIPLTTKKIDSESFEQLQKLIDALEDDDDVQKVWHNVEYDESLAN